MDGPTLPVICTLRRVFGSTLANDRPQFQYGGGFGLHAPDICRVVSYVPGGWEKTEAAKFAALGIEEGDDN